MTHPRGAGELWTFGAGGHGVLGHGSRETLLLPKRVESLAGVQVVRVPSLGSILNCIIGTQISEHPIQVYRNSNWTFLLS